MGMGRSSIALCPQAMSAPRFVATWCPWIRDGGPAAGEVHVPILPVPHLSLPRSLDMKGCLFLLSDPQ